MKRINHDHPPSLAILIPVARETALLKYERENVYENSRHFPRDLLLRGSRSMWRTESLKRTNLCQFTLILISGIAS